MPEEELTDLGLEDSEDSATGGATSGGTRPIIFGPAPAPAPSPGPF